METETNAIAEGTEGTAPMDQLVRKPGKFLVLSDNMGQIGWDAVYEDEDAAIRHVLEELEPANCAEAFVIPITAFYQRD
jgi:hypothetical protein